MTEYEYTGQGVGLMIKANDPKMQAVADRMSQALAKSMLDTKERIAYHLMQTYGLLDETPEQEHYRIRGGE